MMEINSRDRRTPMLTMLQTMELAHMQVGEGGKANFIVSTLIEAEHLKGFVKQRQARGDEASVSMQAPNYRLR